jgi:ATP-dependent DNA helicase RecG
MLLNAIVHRDYANPTDVIIKIYDESIEITNPGKLMGDLTIEKLISGNYISKHRNKLLTEAFYLTGDIEKYGTGFKRVNEWFKDYPSLEYKLYNLSDFIQVKIKNEPLNEPLNERKEQILAKTVGETVEKTVKKTVGKTVGETVGEILSIIKKNPRATRNEISKKTGLSIRGVEWNLKILKDKGIVKRVGPNKGGHWEVINQKP